MCGGWVVGADAAGSWWHWHGVASRSHDGARRPPGSKLRMQECGSVSSDAGPCWIEIKDRVIAPSNKEVKSALIFFCTHLIIYCDKRGILFFKSKFHA